MSKRENQWYLVGNAIDVLRKRAKPRVWQVGLWLALLVAFYIGFQSGALEELLRSDNLKHFLENTNSSLFAVVVVGILAAVSLGAGLLLGFARRATARSGYLRALASPGPDALLQAVERSTKMLAALPDGDALRAQAEAIAWAFYGREKDAARALEAVDWKSKAPLIQAIGLSAESMVELLCRRDAPRALELAEKARAMSALGTAVPGASQNKRYHNTCVAVADAFLGIDLASRMNWLEESAADARYPSLQLYASFGLAAAMERSGNLERAGQLRDFVRRVAPHCALLQVNLKEIAPSGARSEQRKEGLVSASLSSGDSAPGAVQERLAKRKIFRAVAVTAGLWALLIVMFFVLFSIFAK